LHAKKIINYRISGQPVLVLDRIRWTREYGQNPVWARRRTKRSKEMRKPERRHNLRGGGEKKKE